MIAILVSLLGRPENVKKLIQSWREANAGYSELLFALDEDDPKLNELLDIIAGFRYIVGKYPSVCQKIQDNYESFKDDKFLVYHSSADDITYSKGFDAAILSEVNYLEALAGHRCWVLYGNDMVQGQKLCTHWMATKEYIDAVGYFTPSGYMKHCFTDNTFYITALSLGILRYVPWVITYHHSWANNEAPKDVNFDLAYRQDRVKYDTEKYELWCKEELPKNINKIMEAANEAIKRRDSSKG